MLFIDNSEAQVLELHAVADEGMRAHKQVHRPISQARNDLRAQVSLLNSNQPKDSIPCQH